MKVENTKDFFLLLHRGTLLSSHLSVHELLWWLETWLVISPLLPTAMFSTVTAQTCRSALTNHTSALLFPSSIFESRTRQGPSFQLSSVSISLNLCLHAEQDVLQELPLKLMSLDETITSFSPAHCHQFHFPAFVQPHPAVLERTNETQQKREN